MALTLTYKITGLKKRDQVNSEGATLQGAVVQTYWECEGTDENGNKAKFSGATPFDASNVPAGTFVAFENLTEETVISWVKNVVDTSLGYKEHIEERIRDQIDQENVTDAAMPWAPDDVTPTPGAAAAASEPEATPEDNAEPEDSANNA